MKVFDLEADDLLDGITKIHCVSYTEDGENYHSVTNYEGMRKLFSEETILICHNVVRYDKRALEKILGIKIKAKLYDTLAMSWVFEPSRGPREHGLEAWGETFGIPKPPVEDWKNLTLSEYVHRCEEDVKINFKVWKHLIKKAKAIYDDKEELERFLQYLSFKMECAAKAEDSGWKLDIPLVKDCIEKLSRAKEEKVEELRNHMPMNKKFRKKSFPKNPFKKDGTLSAHGHTWKKLLDEQGLPSNYKGDIEVLQKVEPANPASSDQVKAWLFSLGWEPCTFDYKKNDAGEERAIPQVRKDGELTPSVKVLIEKNPGVAVLDGLTVIQHRLSIFEGLMELQVNGYVKAEIAGLTNTLRFKHKKPLVNLPGVDKPWGKEIRGALTCGDDEVLCGADMVSLEDSTRRHYIKPLDPQLVEEQSKENYDPHLQLAVEAGMLSKEDYDFYVNYQKEG